MVEDEPSLTVWEDKAEIKNEVTPELVIFLKTEKIAFLESEKLIKLFLDEKLFTSTIELINSQFEELYEKEKSKNPYSQIHFDIPFDTPSSISLESKIPLLHSQMLKYGTTATLHHCDYFSANSYFRHALSHWHALRQASNIYVLDAAVNTSYFPDQKILIFLSANHPIAQNDLQHLLKNLQEELNSTKK